MPPTTRKQTTKAPSSKKSTAPRSRSTKTTENPGFQGEGQDVPSSASVPAPANYSYTNFASSVDVGKEVNGVTVSLLLSKLEEIEPERKWRSQEEVGQVFEFNPTLSVIEFAGELADCGVAVEVVGADMYVLEVLTD